VPGGVCRGSGRSPGVGTCDGLVRRCDRAAGSAGRADIAGRLDCVARAGGNPAQQMEPQDWAAAWSTGHGMNRDEAVAYALSTRRDRESTQMIMNDDRPPRRNVLRKSGHGWPEANPRPLRTRASPGQRERRARKADQGGTAHIPSRASGRSSPWRSPPPSARSGGAGRSTRPHAAESSDLADRRLPGRQAKNEVDWGDRIYQAVKDQIKRLELGERVEVQRVHEASTTRSRPPFGDSRKATMVLWGWYDDLNVRPRFELLQTARQFESGLGPAPKDLVGFDLDLRSDPRRWPISSLSSWD